MSSVPMILLAGGALLGLLAPAQDTRPLRFHPDPSTPGAEEADGRLARHEIFLESVQASCPDDWKPTRKDSVTVLNGGNARFAKALATELDVTLDWLDDRLEAFGRQQPLRPPMVLLCPSSTVRDELARDAGLHPQWDGVLLTWDVPVSSNQSGASGRFQTFGAEGPSQPSETRRLRRELCAHWMQDRDRHAWWAMPGWLRDGLAAVAGDYELKGRKLQPPKFVNHVLRQKLERLPLLPLRELFTSAETAPQRHDEARAWCVFFLDGPGARKSAWKGRLDRYLAGVTAAVAEMRAKEGAPGRPGDRGAEASMLAAEREGWESRRAEIAERAFDAAFADLDEKELADLEQAFRRWVEQD